MRTPENFRSPYPGLRPFERHEDALFFGRDEQVDQLLDKLSATHFLAVLGTSGSGKSSLVRAGLLPALDSGYMAGAGARWDVAELRPGDHPFRRLATSLIKDTDWGRTYATSVPVGRAILNLEKDLLSGSMALNWRLGVQPLAEGTRLLILVDQFEELFRYQRSNQREAADFVALLLAAASSPKTYVVITLRSEYLKDCSVYPDLPEAINQGLFLTPSLTPEQMADAIQLPAELPHFGGTVEPELVLRLLEEARGQLDQLPLLQHTLMRLWDLDDGDKRLTLAELEALGGLRRALDDHVEETFSELDAEQQRIAEVLFRSLTERGSAERDTRRSARLGAIADLAEVDWTRVADVVEFFRKPGRSFLFPWAGTPLTRESRLDISHEALIRQWGRLRDWTANEAEQAELYQRLQAAALRHKAGKEALWIDPGLEIALQWRDKHNPKPHWAERYGGDFQVAMDFLDQSRNARDLKRRADEQRLAEELQQKRELDLTKESAEKERRLRAKETRLRRRWQRTFAVAIVFLLMAIAGGWWAWSERTEKVAEAENARKAEAAAKKAWAALEVEQIRGEYSKSRDLRAAIEALGKVVRDLNPRSAQAFALRGSLYADLARQADPRPSGFGDDTNKREGQELAPANSADGRNYENALRDLSESLAIEPWQPGVFLTRAGIFRDKGEIRKALEDYDAVIQLSRGQENQHLYYYNRGQLRASAPTPDVRGAIEDYTKAIHLNPRFAEAYFERAVLFRQQGDRTQAIDDLNAAVRYASDDATRKAAKTRLEELGIRAASQVVKSEVYIHYVNRADKPLAEAVKDALQASYQVPKVEFVPNGRTSGDVRYFVTDDQARLRVDERAAAAIAEVVEKTLAGTGHKVNIQTLALDQKYWSLGRAGLFEIWLPSLSHARPQLIGRDDIF